MVAKRHKNNTYQLSSIGVIIPLPFQSSTINFYIQYPVEKSYREVVKLMPSNINSLFKVRKANELLTGVRLLIIILVCSYVRSNPNMQGGRSNAPEYKQVWIVFRVMFESKRIKRDAPIDRTARMPL